MTEKKNKFEENKYPKLDSNVNFPLIEEEILKFWKKNKIFEKSVENRPYEIDGKNNEFVFYDGPPFANGLPHYGHLLTGFIKDVYARYQTMLGKRVERRFGWDCHGLPAEMGAEKELGVSGKKEIEDFGIDKFNNQCRSSVMKYEKSWEKYVMRSARWVDFAGSYKTMGKNFMESVLWVFKTLYDKSLVYESMRVMPYSIACQTPLSNFETRIDNSYRPRVDKTITVGFDLQDPKYLKKHFPKTSHFKILAWTTTPWTLPSNLVLAVSEDMEYVCFKKDSICYVLAKFALEKYAKDLGIVAGEIEYKSFKGAHLAGEAYHPLFDYFSDHKNAFKIIEADFVTEGDGTGIVHVAPGFGEDDHELCKKHNIEIVCPVDDAGRFTKKVQDFEGLTVFEANDKIISHLKSQKKSIKVENYTHNYPHCWRTDTPLIYRALPSWYVEVTKIKDKMVELNKQINWIPGHVKNNLFGKWLEGARDWSISRNRYWGTPIPIWKSDDPKYPRIDVYGSIAELERDFGVKIKDLHRPFIDTLTRKNPDDPTGKSTMRRVSDVFDCWFESGAMPYGQVHFPFENKDWFKNHFPADFIVEYTAQTRGWFYTLMVLATALFERPPFLNCICHGVILDSSGQKLSKRLNNYADPIEIFNKFGADALRACMLSSTVVTGQELLIDKEGVLLRDSIRLLIKPIWNAYHFFCLYANADKETGEIKFDYKNPLDKYIISKLKLAIEQIKDGLDNFNTQPSYKAISDFFEILNNWYIRRSRVRFWRRGASDDKKDAYCALYTSLVLISRAGAPLLPILFENIYLGLTKNSLSDNAEIESVHLSDFPKTEKIQEEKALSVAMDKIVNICSTALFVRSQEKIRVRQPLNKITIVSADNVDLSQFEEIIKDEINIKKIEYSNKIDDFADLKLIINFPLVGKRLPSSIKNIIAALKLGNWELIEHKSGTLQAKSVKIAEEILFSKEFKLQLIPRQRQGVGLLSSGAELVILDLEITENLKLEGDARDLIRHIQQARKIFDLDIADKIEIDIFGEFDFTNLIEKFSDLINEQTLCKKIKSNGISSYHTDQKSYKGNFTGKDIHIICKKI